jgi:hypothetical protein
MPICLPISKTLPQSLLESSVVRVPQKTSGKPLEKTDYSEADLRKFWSRVNKNGPIPQNNPALGPCWIWTETAKQYARLYINGKARFAHRVAYSMNASIPSGATIDHLCLNKICVNPNHLEAVTLEENLSRAAKNRTKCKHGHEYTIENTRIDRKGKRVCRTCARRHSRISDERERAKPNA